MYPQIGQTAHTLRTSAETWGADGRPVRSYADAGTLWGSLQAAPGQVLQRLPDGLRAEVTRVLYSRSEVPVPVQQDGTPTAPAQIVSGGTTYNVRRVEVYAQPGLVLRHWAVLLSPVPERATAGSP